MIVGAVKNDPRRVFRRAAHEPLCPFPLARARA
jgi:hypothetical protein